MRKQSTITLPVVYANSKPVVSVADGRRGKPIDLIIYDVTYLHYHQYFELGVCISGSGVCQVEDSLYSFTEGDVEIIFPYQRHLSKSTGDTTSVWYWANIDVSEVLSRAGFTAPEQVQHWMQSEMGLCGIIDKTKYSEICASVKNIFSLLHSEENTVLHPQELFANTLMGLILQLCEASQTLPKLSLHASNFAESLAPALNQISSDIRTGKIPKVKDLPTCCSMSPANFRRIFEKTLGLSPKEYITRCCIHKAKKLLACTNMPVSQISNEIGYENISGFNRSFHDQTGMAPTDFRKLMQA